jgi:hypothetical protein
MKKSNGKLRPGSKVQNQSWAKGVQNGGLQGNWPLNGTFDMQGGPYGQGTSALSSQYEFFTNTSAALISLQRVLLSYAYVLFGPLRTLVDQPVYDAFRGGVKIKSDEVSPEELEDLHKLLKKLKVEKKAIDALRWDRLFGGAGVIINTNQDYTTPFTPDMIKEGAPLQFIVADRWELMWQGLPNAPKSTFAYYPGSGYSQEQVQTGGDVTINDELRFNISKIHQSRVCKVISEEAPSLVRQRLQGWGMSVIEAVIRECNSYFKEQNVIFELLDEAKVDIWKIKGFNASVLSQIARGQTSSRIQLAQMMKNFLNAVTLDKEDDYEQKQITFGGLSEIMEQLRIGLSAAIRLPESKIFGLSASGFASGEDSLEMYASIVEIQREKAEDVLEVIIPCCMMSLWGFIPDDWQIEWSPVRTLSAEQTEIIKNAKFARTMQMVQAGLLTPQEFMEYCQEEEIYQGESEVLKGAEPIPLMGAMGDEESLKEPASKPEKDDNGKENNKLRQNKSLLLNKS